MTSTTRFPGIFTRVRLLALVLVAVSAAVLAGCSDEGKTIQNPLPVPGIAYDVTAYRETTLTTDAVPPVDTFTTIATVDVRLKVQTVYQNGCEAKGGLELRLIADELTRTYVVTPLARYTADEECNVGASGDTLQTLVIKNLTITKLNSTIAADESYAHMQVAGSTGPPIDFILRYDLATPGADSTIYDIKVEDATTGLPLDGALVTVQQYGTPNTIGEGTTAGGGKFSFEVAYGAIAGTPGDSYIVKVSYAGRITIFRAIDFPSLNKRREAIVVRV